jgi:hypothetical protein
MGGFKIRDTKKEQLNCLKDNLEDLELYLREIEHTLEMYDSSADEKVKSKCRVNMARIQQRILDISKLVLNEHSSMSMN